MYKVMSVYKIFFGCTGQEFVLPRDRVVECLQNGWLLFLCPRCIMVQQCHKVRGVLGWIRKDLYPDVEVCVIVEEVL